MIYDGGEILTETSPAGYLINDYIFFGGKRVAAAPNDLNLNGGFEQGLTNWTASGSGTATAVNNPANAHSGNYYAEVTAPAGYTSTTLSTTQPISSQVGKRLLLPAGSTMKPIPPATPAGGSRSRAATAAALPVSR